jgi:hypothetical protein
VTTRWLRAIAIALAAAAAALTAMAAIGATGAGPARATKGGFTLAGHIRGLLPGVRRRLVITVHNRGRHPLMVRSISVRIVRAPSPGCAAKNLHVSRFRGRLRLRGHATRRIAVRIWILRDSPSACQGAVFPLVFKGRATRG